MEEGRGQQHGSGITAAPHALLEQANGLVGAIQGQSRQPPVAQGARAVGIVADPRQGLIQKLVGALVQAPLGQGIGHQGEAPLKRTLQHAAVLQQHCCQVVFALEGKEHRQKQAAAHQALIQSQLLLAGLLSRLQVAHGTVRQAGEQPALGELVVGLLIEEPKRLAGPAGEDQVAGPGIARQGGRQGWRQPTAIDLLGGLRLPEQQGHGFCFDGRPSRGLTGLLITNTEPILQLREGTGRRAHSPETLQKLVVTEFKVSLAEAGIMRDALPQ